MERYGCNSNINEPLFHYYFLLQCTRRYRINTPSHPVYVGVFPPTFQSRTFLFQACLLILSDLLDKIFYKKGNFLSWKCFEVSYYWQKFLGCLNPHQRKSTSTFSGNSYIIFIKVSPSLTDKPHLDLKLRNCHKFIKARY